MTPRTPKRAAEDRAPVGQGRAARTATAPAGAGQPDPSVIPMTDGSGPASSSLLRERPAARAPSPDPGECSQRGGTALGPGTARTSAGGVPSESSAPLAGEGRTYTLALPPGLALLNLNDRGHWGARYRRSEALKKAAWALALSQKIPRLERVSVTVEYQPRDLRRRDGDNIAASAKALIDGIRAAGVLPEDDSRHVAEVTCRIGTLYPKGRLVLTLTEVPGGADAA